MDDWLRSIGLGDRVAVFREQGITLDLIGQLTEQDLRELGLTIGERKRFIQARNNQSPAANPTHANPPPRPPPAPTPEPTHGERRPLTVMFVDLVGSTPLGERLDPEDLLEVTRRYREFCGGAIARYGGSVARFVGDGILAYFGYPTATEDDPERAVRAALDIVRGIEGLATLAEEPLQVRIGLATGLAVVSDLNAGGLEEKSGITGGLPNLAARLQGLAGANGIVVGEHTYTRIGARFVCEPLGGVQLRGFDRPIEAARIIGERLAERLQHPAPGRQHLTRLYARETEIALLRGEWKRVTEGEGRVVLVVGEAGIGKSRLIEQLLGQDLPEGAAVQTFAASPFSQDTPLGVLADHLRARAGLAGTDTPEAALARLEAVMVGDPPARQQAALILAGLLGIPVADPAIAALTPDELRQQTIGTLVAQTLAHAADAPLCLVVEDLHWLDPTSRELLGHLARAVGGHRILLLLSAREGADDLVAGLRATVLRLERLGRAPIAAMIRDLIGEGALPDRLVDQVSAKTDGVPLFVEEVGRLLLERQTTLRADDLSDDNAETAIPRSLHESLIARLDRSGPAKHVAQIAAVIGRSVRHDILVQVAGMAPGKLLDALSDLVEAGILERYTGRGRDMHIFSHALVRDAAYASLLRGRRRDLHGRVARALESDREGTAARSPEILALHLTEAGLAEDAAPYWIEAAKRSLARSALTEATRMLRRGLDALEKLPETDPVLGLRLNMSALLGPALIGLDGPLAATTLALYSAARAMALRLPQDPSHFPLHWGWWRLSADGNDNLHRSGELLGLAKQLGKPDLLMQAHHSCWASHLHYGAFDRFCEHVDAGLAIYEQDDYRHLAGLYGNHDARVCAQGALSQVYWMQGRLADGLRAEQESLGWSRRLDHLGSRVHAMGLTLLHRVYRRDYAEVFARSSELIDLTSDHGLADHGAAGLLFSGWVIGMRDDAAVGLAQLEEGFARQREIATTEDFPVYLCLLADLLVRCGKPEAAIERIEAGIPEFDRIGLRMWMPELLRVLADTMLAADAGATARAEALLAQAHAMAETQQVPMLGLRIASSRARLSLRLGAPEQAEQALTIALDKLPAGESSDDHIAAQHLLAGLPAGCVRR